MCATGVGRIGPECFEVDGMNMEGEHTAAEVNPHLYKPEFTKEEVDELLKWFEQRDGRLPQTLKLNSSTQATDLPRTVGWLTRVLKSLSDKPLAVTFYGYVSLLALVRLRLQEQGME